MKKRLLALALCLVLALGILPPMATAEENVFFTAMGESILPLDDATMPFLSGTSIYIPSSIFTGTVRKSLDISSTYNRSQALVILYRGSQSLWFDLTTGEVWDNEETVYYSPAILRGDEVFVSASLVARFFGVTYTLTEVPHGYMVWFRKPDYPLSDVRFADAASYSMTSRYNAYVKKKEQEQQQAQQTPNQGAVMGGKSVYLALAATVDPTPSLRLLDGAGVQGALFLTPQVMEGSGSALRRAVTLGHSVGILLSREEETDLLTQAARANAALEGATCMGTRFVYLPEATEEERTLLTAAGYCCAEFDLHRESLRTKAQAQELVRTISRRRGGVSVWLGRGSSVAGLDEVIQAVKEADGRLRCLTETT